MMNNDEAKNVFIGPSHFDKSMLLLRETYVNRDLYFLKKDHHAFGGMHGG